MLRFFSVFQLLRTYFTMGEYSRVVRFLDQNTSSNLNIKDHLYKHTSKSNIRDELTDPILHILATQGDSYALIGHNDKAVEVLTLVCKLYNKWKVVKREDPNYEKPKSSGKLMSAYEFGIDDSIKVRASLAECLMNCGRNEDAIEKFESVKKCVLQEVVFDKPVLMVNIYN